MSASWAHGRSRSRTRIIGFLLVSGRWFNGAGEAVAPRALLLDAHLKIGDRVIVIIGNKPVSLVLVGDVLDANSGGTPC